MTLIKWSTLVSAHGQTRTVSDWSRSRYCFVKPAAFHGRLLHLGVSDPDPLDVEAALCFDSSTWRFYRRHGYITENHVSIPIPVEDQWDAAEAWEDLELEAKTVHDGIADLVKSLPEKHRHILRMTIQGVSVYHIGRALGLSPNTVAFYKTVIKRRLGISTFRDGRLRHLDAIAAMSEETT